MGHQNRKAVILHQNFKKGSSCFEIQRRETFLKSTWSLVVLINSLTLEAQEIRTSIAIIIMLPKTNELDID